MSSVVVGSGGCGGCGSGHSMSCGPVYRRSYRRGRYLRRGRYVKRTARKSRYVKAERAAVRAASRYGSTAQAQSVLDAMLRKAEKFKERVLLGRQLAETRAAYRSVSATATGVPAMSADDEGAARGSPRARSSYYGSGFIVGPGLATDRLGSTFDLDA